MFLQHCYYANRIMLTIPDFILIARFSTESCVLNNLLDVWHTDTSSQHVEGKYWMATPIFLLHLVWINSNECKVLKSEDWETHSGTFILTFNHKHIAWKQIKLTQFSTLSLGIWAVVILWWTAAVHLSASNKVWTDDCLFLLTNWFLH